MDKLPAFLGLLLVALPLTFALGAHSPTDDAVSSANVELVLVQVVIRHGARSPYVLFGDEVGIQWNCTAHPVGSFGTSPISSLSPRNRVYAGAYVPDVQVLHGNCAQGELTLQGSEMHISLGQTNAQRYQGFLSPFLNASQIYVRSTAVPRTVESAASFLSGLYPESTVGSNIDVQTIWMIEEPNDNMQLPSNCGLINQICNAVQSSEEWIARLTAMKPLQNKLATEWGIPISEFPVWTNIQSTLQCRTAAGVANPSYMTQADYDSIMDLANWMMAQLWNSTRQALLINGPLLNELSNNMKQAMVDTGIPIFRLYSAHDTTVGPLLAGLGAFPKDWPPFAANVNLELYRSTTAADAWYVRGLYLGEVISFGGRCAEYCPFSEFLSIIRPVTIDYPGRNSLCNSVGYAAPLNDYTSFLC